MIARLIALVVLVFAGVAHAEVPANCTVPATMLAMGGARDFKALSEPQKADLRRYQAEAPQFLAAHGGSFKARGPASAVIEGDWPAWQNLVLIGFPCVEAGQRFWHAEKYQKELFPLRRETAPYRMALFGPAPKDPRATGVWTAEGGPAAKGLKCDVPVYFLVTAEVKDGPKLMAYRKALTESGIQYAYGATDVLQGAPAEVLEQDWPVNFNAKVTRWPCKEAFDAWYASTEYQTKYKPLRKDAAVFQAVIGAEVK